MRYQTRARGMRRVRWLGAAQRARIRRGSGRYTTGAGDCFVGAFLAALQAGNPTTEAARVANAAGALSVRRAGATTGLLDLPGTLEWIRSREPLRLT